MEGPNTPLRAPVVVIAFNRPDSTARVFAAVRAARPARLFVLTDGPRPGRPDDEARVAEVRQILDAVDWPCEVHRRDAPVNLGLPRHFLAGLSWVFGMVDEAIIVEDDCLPDATFFPFCDALLARYRDDPRVTSIAGSQFVERAGPDEASYRFSRYALIWGWATWRRAWQGFDPRLGDWPAARDSGWIARQFDDARARDFWSYIFDQQWRLGDDANWDYAWQFRALQSGGLCAQANVNLVSNLGFGDGATHTTHSRDPFANLPCASMRFPLRHPPAVAPDARADRALDAAVFGGTLNRLMTHLRARIRRSS